MRSMIPFALTLTLLTTAGCGANASFRDHNFVGAHVLGRRADYLSSLYAVHSNLQFVVAASRDLTGYQVRSSDTDVLRLDGAANVDEDLRVFAVALSSGTATLELVNAKGRVVDDAEVEVRRPDHFRLLSKAMIQAGASTDDAAVDTFHLLQNSDGALYVEALDGTLPLAGDAGLSVLANDEQPVAGIAAALTTEPEANRMPVLHLTADQSVATTVPLFSGGEQVLAPAITLVEPDQVRALELIGDEQDKKPDDRVVLHARATDPQGVPILGVNPRWQIEDRAQDSGGDIYGFDLDPDDPNTLIVGFDDVEVRTTIHGSGNAGDSTATTGCSTTTAPNMGWVLLLGLLGLRKRRR